MLLAVFRADASPDIGGGHVMRCLTLADALADRGWRCAVACNAGAAQTVPALAASRHELRELGDDEAADPTTLWRYWPLGADLLVVDYYGLDKAYEASSRPWTRHVLVIDDLANRAHDADLLLDQTLGRRDSDYRSRVPPACRLLLGTGYALLRPEFARARQQALRRRAGRESLKRVLISMGASDPENITGRVLDAIRDSGLHLTVDVILGAAAPHCDTVTEQLRSLPGPCVLHVDPPVTTMIDIMITVDLSIGAGGMSAWERCCLGLPSILVVLADNQRVNASALQQRGAAFKLDLCTSGIWKHLMQDKLIELTERPSQLENMSQLASSVCDGFGVERIVRHLDFADLSSAHAIRHRWRNENK